MRIGLISDTHIPEAGPDLPPQVYDVFKGVDVILHAGDIHVIDVLDWLEGIAPVLAARGNGDGDVHRPPFPDNDARVKMAHTLDLDGLRVGLVHGFPLPGETPWISTEALMERHFGGLVDVLVCGDTHMARIDWYRQAMIINPGSPTLPNNIRRALGTVGILTIEDGIPQAEIIQLS